MTSSTSPDARALSTHGMRRGYVQTRLGQLHYATAGDADKPPVLLLPQTARTWPMFAGLAEQLAGRYRLVAIDYPGSGSSDTLRAGTTIEDIAGAIVDALDDLRLDRVHVYGIHGGNKVGAALAAGWPQRVKKLVLAGQSHSIVPSNAKRTGTVGKTRRKLLKPADERETALVRWADLFNIIGAAWWREGLMRDIANPAQRAKALLKVADEVQSAEGTPHFYAANFVYDFERDLHRIQVPTLVLEIATPHEDHAVGRQGPQLLAIIPGSTLATFEEEDFHGITLEDKAAELAATLADFFG